MTTRFAIACLLCFASISAAGTIGVPGDYATIQEALDASVAGDVIEVAPGTYTGSGDAVVTMPSHPVTLRSIGGAEVTVIDAENVRRGMVIQQADPVQWRTEDGGNGHWYQVITTEGNPTWSESADYAVSIGGHLATFEAEDEYLWCKDNIVTPDGVIDAWLGLYQEPGSEEPSGGWFWITGPSAAGFSGWFCDEVYCEPNDNNGEDCAYIYCQYPQDSIWFTCRDVPCDTWGGIGHHFVEWDADCNGDGIVDYGQIMDGTFEDENGDGVPDTCVCPADLDEDLLVSVNDLLIVIAQWGSSASLGDINNDGMTNVDDLLLVIQSWGACS